MSASKTSARDRDYDAPRHQLLRPQKNWRADEEPNEDAVVFKRMQRYPLERLLSKLKKEPAGDEPQRSPDSVFRKARQPRPRVLDNEEVAVPWLRSPRKPIDLYEEEEEDEPMHTRPRSRASSRAPSPRQHPEGQRPTAGSPRLGQRSPGRSRPTSRDGGPRRPSDVAVEDERWLPDGWARKILSLMIFAVFVLLVLEPTWRSLWQWQQTRGVESSSLQVPEDPLGLRMYHDYVKGAVDDFSGLTDQQSGVDMVGKIDAEIKYIVRNLDSFNKNWIEAEPAFGTLDFTEVIEEGLYLQNVSRRIEIQTNALIRSLILQKHVANPALVQQMFDETVQVWTKVDKLGKWKRRGLSLTTYYTVEVEQWFPKWYSYLAWRRDNASRSHTLAKHIVDLIAQLKKNYLSLQNKLDDAFELCRKTCQGNLPHKLGHTKEQLTEECNSKVEKMLKSTLYIGREDMPERIQDFSHALQALRQVHGTFSVHVDNLTGQALEAQQYHRNKGIYAIDGFQGFLKQFVDATPITLPLDFDTAAILEDPIGTTYYTNTAMTLQKLLNPKTLVGEFAQMLHEDGNHTVHAARTFMLWTNEISHQSPVEALKRFNFRDTIVQSIETKDDWLRLWNATTYLNAALIPWFNNTLITAGRLEERLDAAPDGGLPYVYRGKENEEVLEQVFGDVVEALHGRLTIHEGRVEDVEERLLEDISAVLRLSDELLVSTLRLHYRWESSIAHAKAVCEIVAKPHPLNTWESLQSCSKPPRFDARDSMERTRRVREMIEELKIVLEPLFEHAGKAREVRRLDKGDGAVVALFVRRLSGEVGSVHHAFRKVKKGLRGVLEYQLAIYPARRARLTME